MSTLKWVTLCWHLCCWTLKTDSSVDFEEFRRIWAHRIKVLPAMKHLATHLTRRQKWKGFPTQVSRSSRSCTEFNQQDWELDNATSVLSQGCYGKRKSDQSLTRGLGPIRSRNHFCFIKFRSSPQRSIDSTIQSRAPRCHCCDPGVVWEIHTRLKRKMSGYKNQEDAGSGGSFILFEYPCPCLKRCTSNMKARWHGNIWNALFSAVKNLTQVVKC